MTTIGIIGGTGLYSLDGLTNVHENVVETPFGTPSDAFITGELKGAKLVFVPRHGRTHRFLPSEVPYRANIYALKTLQVECVISVSAVGSLQEHIHPGEIVLPNQFLDLTRGRPSTFFGQGIVAHAAMADPVCFNVAEYLAKKVSDANVACHTDGTYACIEGPSFSTRAESHLYRSWGANVIGMTAMPEAKLAREAEMHYATLALVTDYDCWRPNEEEVTVDAIMETLRTNTSNVCRVLEQALPGLAEQLANKQFEKTCSCASSLQTALVTSKDHVSKERQTNLRPLLEKYWT